MQQQITQIEQLEQQEQQQQIYYTGQQIKEIISQTDVQNQSLVNENQNLKRLSEREKIKDVYTQHQLQSDIASEAYYKSRQFQETILTIYYLLKDISNLELISDQLVKQFDGDEMIMNAAAEQILQYFYRIKTQEYLELIVIICKKCEDFREYIERKINKDLKLNNNEVYGSIKYLISQQILSNDLIIQIYQSLIINYCFCYKYNFSNIDRHIKNMHQIIQLEPKITQWLTSIYQNQSLILHQFFNLSIDQLNEINCHILSYQSPNEKINLLIGPHLLDFQYQVKQPINEQSLYQEIMLCIEFCNKPIIESLLPIIIINKQNYAEFIIVQLMNNFLLNKYQQFTVNLIQNTELRKLHFNLNKRKILMKETLQVIIDKQFDDGIKQGQQFIEINKKIFILYNFGLVQKNILQTYIKRIVKEMLQNYCNGVNYKYLLDGMKELDLKLSLKPKDQEIQLLKQNLETIRLKKQLNWFDIDNLVSQENYDLLMSQLSLF